MVRRKKTKTKFTTWPGNKTINKKRFKLHDITDSKKQAQKSARKARTKGKSARILTSSNKTQITKHAVFVRKK